MTKQSVTQNSSSKPASQVRRRWQEQFRQRMQGITLDDSNSNSETRVEKISSCDTIKFRI